MTDTTVLMVGYIDVYIDVPQTLDISFMPSRGLQPGDELLPEDGMCYALAFTLLHQPEKLYCYVEKQL